MYVCIQTYVREECFKMYASVLLCRPTASEADGGGMAEETEPSHQCSGKIQRNGPCLYKEGLF